MHRRRTLSVLGLVVLTTAILWLTAWTRTRTDAGSSSPTTTTSSTTLTPIEVPTEPLGVVILGDSYTQLDQWASEVATAANWDHDNLALSGTGYVSTAGRSACGLDICPNFGDQLDAAASLRPTPDVVIITGGVNDPTGEVVTDAVHDTYTKARALFPDATIVGFSPFGKATEFPDSLVTLRGIIRTEVEAIGGVFVDVGHPLADHPEFIRADGLHPNDEGQHLLALAILNALREQTPELLR